MSASRANGISRRPFEQAAKAWGRYSWNPDIDAWLLYLQVPLYTIACFVPVAFGIFRSRNITA